MSKKDTLSKDEIKKRINDLQNWKQDGDSINREIAAENFADAVGIVNAIAVLAEANDHHPDILIYGWNKVRITLTSHDKGGLTKKDFNLAQKIEELKF
jgi:4a-hydroxytetrahydrobiopterin dehydratase